MDNPFCVRATIWLFLNIVQYNYCFQLPLLIPSAPSNMSVERAQPKQSYIDILSVIRQPLFPPNLVVIKEKICNLVLQNVLEVEPIVTYLATEDYMDKFELMIAALLATRDTLPFECALRKEIGQLIIESTFKRCKSESPRSDSQQLQIDTENLSCESIRSELRDYEYLYKRKQCNRNCHSNNFSSSIFNKNYYERASKAYYNSRRSVSTNTSSKNIEVNNQSKLIDSFIKIIHTPKNSMEKKFLDIISSFVKSSDFANYFKEVAIRNSTITASTFKLIVEKVVSSNISIAIKDAFNYYLNYDLKQYFDYSTLVALLPQPIDDEERTYYALVKNILTNKDNYQYLSQINATSYKDQKLLFKDVLLTLSKVSYFNEVTKVALKYYLNYNFLINLQLDTKREIQKHFELTSIFQDTLEIDSLQNYAQVAFKKFFKFMSKISQEAMADFDSWSDVKTKGEFMKVLFKYFLDKASISQDIKKAIRVLEPLVRMDGKGAQPL